MKEEMKTISMSGDNEPSETTALRQKLESIDDMLPYVGNFGRYQWYLLLALLPYSIAYSNLYFSQIFFTLVPNEHWCYVDALQDTNMTQEERVLIAIPESNVYPYYDKCRMKDLNFSRLVSNEKNFYSPKWQTNRTVECDNWEYNFTQIPYKSIGVELNWVCEKEYLISTAQAIFFAGSIIGGVLFGWIADHRGRIPALFLCYFASLLATIATASTTNFWSFALCRFLTGLAFDNCVNIPLIIVVEYMAVKRRTLVFNIAFGLYFAAGSTILPWLAYYIANWRYFAYVSAIPLFCGLFTPWILPESARWYVASGKLDKVVEKLRKIAKINRKNPDPRIYQLFFRNAHNAQIQTESATFLDLFKTPRLARNVIMLTAFWFLTVIVFDGHVYSLKLLQSNVFVSFSLACATELPAGLLLTLTLDRWGRRFCGFLTMAATGIFSFGELYLTSGAAQLSMSVLARFSLNMAANIGLQYAAELLPTPVRAQGVSLIHIFGILAHCVAPYLVDTAKYWTVLPMLILGVISFVTATLVLFLPETLGRDLPQTLSQGENFGRGDKFWSLPCSQKTAVDRRNSRSK
ncbi:carcinine transporter-like isoform X2 [Venturia canescens]|nr:carcinine transporter-like isoform X2 [Venturia canescens]XP_043271472.1 carcinine transporter-like isoform X2 [Venturia canescens]XP_043271473.1 carcinine transporter-like isoform X2 [Venturia canescens]XP_043271474.1 carcinine transporter-like isoform X2 [Venturia canescens]